MLLDSAPKYIFQQETFTSFMLWGCESVLLALRNRKIPKGLGSGAVTSSCYSFSINQALAYSTAQHLNTLQRSEQKQLLSSQFETSDMIHPRHPQIGNRSRAPAWGQGLEETSSLLLPTLVPQHLHLNCLQLSSPRDEEQCEGRAQV